MSPLVNETTQTIVMSINYNQLSMTFGILATLLLVFLLLQKDILSAMAGPRVQSGVKALHTIIYPLLLSFGAIVVLRLVVLLVSGIS